MATNRGPGRAEENETDSVITWSTSEYVTTLWSEGRRAAFLEGDEQKSTEGARALFVLVRGPERC
jgi:hypothetical protein